MTEWSVLPEMLPEMMAYLKSGGQVMIPIAGVSLWMWLLIFKKLAELRWYRQNPLSLHECFDVLSGGASHSLSGWQSNVVCGFKDQRSFKPETDKKLMKELIHQEHRKMEKHIPTILVLASVAPLLGLLGTVTGMISTFDVISRFGAGNAKALASGVSEALITTQSGLIVAIPGLFMGNYLNRSVQRLEARMERFCLGFCRECEKTAKGEEAR